ncbi:MAG: hypothetical protein MZV63_62055 [Marinilabiliales bacterium]|nr:hypothetical protein [Marinilabiliales bacterium]
MEIQEWRGGLKIGVVVRDMQIEVYETDNHPPVTSPLTDLCVEVGETVSFDITATDIDGDSVLPYRHLGDIHFIHMSCHLYNNQLNPRTDDGKANLGTLPRQCQASAL